MVVSPLGPLGSGGNHELQFYRFAYGAGHREATLGVAAETFNGCGPFGVREALYYRDAGVLYEVETWWTERHVGLERTRETKSITLPR